MSDIVHIRDSVSQEVFDYQILLDTLRQYRKPRDRISRLIAAGEIVRVKKGLYVFAEAFRRQPVVREHLANLIYGPSYVSLDSALSHHGLIPERVESVTSVTTGRSRWFDTPFGRFTYQSLALDRYALGALLSTGGVTPYLIASPEKALVDKVWLDKRFSGTRTGDFGPYLHDDLRIDAERLQALDDNRLTAIAGAYSSAKIDKLLRFLKKTKRVSNA
ncbi:MAG: hypothetical protein WCL44_06660 [bacterium]